MSVVLFLQVDNSKQRSSVKKKMLLSMLVPIMAVTPLMAISEKEKDYWIDKYLSVSFPLKSIKVNCPYGNRTDPFDGKSKRHSGIDLSANYEDVLSMFDGYVRSTGYDSTSGKYIVAQFGDYTVSYCHLSEIWVKPKMRIYAGEAIGVSGSTGRSTGPHLHLTSRLRGQLEDPDRLLEHIKTTRQKALRALRLNEDKVMTPAEFVNSYADMAMRQQRKYGIPSSVTLAQMAYESGWGNSTLAKEGCNFFGIKASRTWVSKGLPYSCHDDDRSNEKFCNFSCPSESMEYHSMLLMSDRYRQCRRYGSRDYHNWLVAIKAAGYATAKDYVAKCERIILTHKLYLYDELAERM